MIRAILEDSAGVTISAEYDHDGQAGADLLTGLSGWSGGVGIRTESIDRLGHGQFPMPSYRTGRTITLDVMLERDSRTDLWALERGVSGLFADGGFGTLTVEADERRLHSTVRLDGDVKATVHLDGGYLEVQVPLQAPDPHLYSDMRTTTLRPTGAGIGLVYAPFTVGGVITFGSDITGQEWVWNDGNADSFPSFVVNGNFPGGFRVGLGDRVVTWPRPVFDGTPVLVDMTGTVLAGGFDQSHYLTSRDWASIGPESIETPRFEPLQGGTGWCEVRHRDTYL